MIVYLEVAESHALDAARMLWGMRLTGWFDSASAVLTGRTHTPAAAGFSQRDAVASALGDPDVPVILDVDCGHVVPALALVNGA
jgi:muramoyltetrapeptide carboxypeptidase